MDIGTLTGAIEIEDDTSEVLDRIADRIEKFSDTFDSLMTRFASSTNRLSTAVEEIEPVFASLGTAAITAGGVITELATTATEAGGVLASSLAGGATSAGESIGKLADDVKTAGDEIGENLVDVAERTSDAGAVLSAGIGKGAEAAGESVNRLALETETASDAVGTSLATAAEKATGASETLASGISTAAASVENLATATATASEAVSSNLVGAAGAGDALAAGLKSSVADTGAVVARLATETEESTSSVRSSLAGAADAGAGLAAGLERDTASASASVEYLATTTDDVANEITKDLNQITDSEVRIETDVAVTNIQHLATETESSSTAISASLSDVSKNAADLGSAISTGLTSGADAAGESVKQLATNVETTGAAITNSLTANVSDASQRLEIFSLNATNTGNRLTDGLGAGAEDASKRVTGLVDSARDAGHVLDGVDKGASSAADGLEKVSTSATAAEAAIIAAAKASGLAIVDYERLANSTERLTLNNEALSDPLQKSADAWVKMSDASDSFVARATRAGGIFAALGEEAGTAGESVNRLSLDFSDAGEAIAGALTPGVTAANESLETLTTGSVETGAALGGALTTGADSAVASVGQVATSVESASSALGGPMAESAQTVASGLEAVSSAASDSGPALEASGAAATSTGAALETLSDSATEAQTSLQQHTEALAQSLTALTGDAEGARETANAYAMLGDEAVTSQKAIVDQITALEHSTHAEKEGSEAAEALAHAHEHVAHEGHEAAGSLGHMAKEALVMVASFTTAEGIIELVELAIHKLEQTLIAFGQRGSEILGVERAFDHLAEEIGTTGKALFEGLNSGVKGTIESFDLMKSTTRLLSSGIKLTADDMKVMGAVAREMGIATGTDAASGLNTLSQALLTGQQRSLRQFGINIDLIKAEREFASSLGATRDQLNQEGRVVAARIAILEGMRTKLETLGVSELSFKEKIQQTEIAIEDWKEGFYKAIAVSPAVSAAFDAIKKSFTDTFGKTSEEVLSSAIGLVDRFANTAARVAPIVFAAFGRIRDTIVEVWTSLVSFNDRFKITDNLIEGARAAWTGLEVALRLVERAAKDVTKAWSELPDWLQRIGEGAFSAGLKLTAFALGATAVLKVTTSILSPLKFVATALGELGAMTLAFGGEGFLVTITSWGEALVGLLTPLGWAAVAVGAVSIAVYKYWDPLKAYATKTWGFIADKVKTAVDAVTGVLTYLSQTVIGQFIINLAELELKIAKWGAVAAAVGIWEGLKLVWEASADAAKTLWSVIEKLWDLLGGNEKIAQLVKEFTILKNLVGTELTKTFQDLGVIYHMVFDPLLAAVKWLNDHMPSAPSFSSEPPPAPVGPNIIGAGPTVPNITAPPKLGEQGALMGLGLSKAQIAAMELEEQMERTAKATEGAGESMLTTGNDAEQFARSVRELTKSMLTGDTSLRVIEATVRRLTPAQLDNLAVVERLAPEILKLEAAHRALTPTMYKVLETDQAIRQGRIDSGVAILEQKNATLDYINAQKQLGKSEVEIARVYGVSVEALQRYEVQLSSVRSITDDLIKSQDALADQRGAQEIKTVTSKAAEAQQAPRINYAAGLISAQEFATRRLEIEENEIAQRFTLESVAIARHEAIEQRDLATRITRGELFYASEAQREQMRADIATKYSLQRIDLAQTEADRQTELAGAGAEAYNRKQKEFVDLARAGSMTRLQIQRHEIDEWAKSEIAGYRGSAAEIKRYSSLVLYESERRKHELLIDQDALRSRSTLVLKDIAATAHETYLKASREAYVWSDEAGMWVEQYSKKAIRELKKIDDAATHQAEHTISTFEKTMRTLDAAGHILDQIPGKWAAIGAFAVNAAKDIGMAFAMGGPLAAALVAVDKLIDGIKKISEAARDGRHAIVDFMDSFDTAAAGTGADEIRDKLLAAGREDLWKKMTQGTGAGDQTAAAKIIKEVQAALDALDRDVQKYNLTWMDLANAQDAASTAGKDLVQTYNRLVTAGYSADTILDKMSVDLNQYIINSVKAGTKIPAAMRPIIESLITQGKLTDAAAKAMLGLADDTMPSLDDVKEAAERYGLSLDALGPKVKQLQITEAANQIVKDFNTLTAAGADFMTILGPITAAEQAVIDLNKKGADTAAAGTPLWQEYQDAVRRWKDEVAAGGEAVDGMRTQVQKLVTSAIAMGLELPSAMKPLIEKMIDAGMLIDDVGEKLTDTSKLHFAADLSAMFETLMTKLDELIDKIGNGVGGALDKLGQKVVSPTIAPRRLRGGAADDVDDSTPQGPTAPAPTPTAAPRTPTSAPTLAPSAASTVAPPATVAAPDYTPAVAAAQTASKTIASLSLAPATPTITAPDYSTVVAAAQRASSLIADAKLVPPSATVGTPDYDEAVRSAEIAAQQIAELSLVPGATPVQVPSYEAAIEAAKLAAQKIAATSLTPPTGVVSVPDYAPAIDAAATASRKISAVSVTPSKGSVEVPDYGPAVDAASTAGELIARVSLSAKAGIVSVPDYGPAIDAASVAGQKIAGVSLTPPADVVSVPDYAPAIDAAVGFVDKFKTTVVDVTGELADISNGVESEFKKAAFAAGDTWTIEMMKAAGIISGDFDAHLLGIQGSFDTAGTEIARDLAMKLKMAAGEVDSAFGDTADGLKTDFSGAGADAAEEIITQIAGATNEVDGDIDSTAKLFVRKLSLAADAAANDIDTEISTILDKIGRSVTRPTIKPIYDDSDLPDAPDTPDRPDRENDEGQYKVQGGKPRPVYAATGYAKVPGEPRGTDRIGVWMGPDERVLTASQNRDYEQATKRDAEAAPVEQITQEFNITIQGNATKDTVDHLVDKLSTELRRNPRARRKVKASLEGAR